MLRMRRAPEPRKAGFGVDYKDPYLTLVRLLVDAATLEHTLLASHLYALFSIKDGYVGVRGELTPDVFRLQPPDARRPSMPHSFLDVAIEELQHLAILNQLLYELHAAPCLERHAFPHRFETYPFELELRSLDRYTAATFTWLEAAAAEFDPELGDERLVEDLKHVITNGSKLNAAYAWKRVTGVERLGSLYARILELLAALQDDAPAFIPQSFEWGVWADRVDRVRNRGEIEHFHFFRSLFTGDAFGADETIWEDPRSQEYPAVVLAWKPALESGRRNNGTGVGHELARLSNLIYGSLLCLLELSCRSDDRRSIQVAIEQLASALWWLGLELAQEHHLGIPLEVMRVRYDLGRDDRVGWLIITRLIDEARSCAERIGRAALPARFDLGVFERTLDLR